MGGRRTTDDEKRQAGTFREGVSKAAYDQAAVNKIHAFPIFREIPKPTVKLGETGQKQYDMMARLLFDAGRLTVFTQQSLEAYCLAKDTVARLGELGKHVPASVLTQMNRSLGDLRLAEVDASLTPKKPSSQNKFRRNGWASRARR